jgi:hypothetical protein
MQGMIVPSQYSVNSKARQLENDGARDLEAEIFELAGKKVQKT